MPAPGFRAPMTPDPRKNITSEHRMLERSAAEAVACKLENVIFENSSTIARGLTNFADLWVGLAGWLAGMGWLGWAGLSWAGLTVLG